MGTNNEYHVYVIRSSEGYKYTGMTEDIAIPAAWYVIRNWLADYPYQEGLTLIPFLQAGIL